MLAPCAALAQVSLPAAQEKLTITQAESGGKVAFEQLRATLDRPSLPLRYGHVKVGSESVQSEGRTLVRDKDYYVDYVAGVVYLKFAYRENQSVSVQYNYDEATGTKGTFGLGTSGSKFQGYTFHLNPNTSMILGMGLTERMGDGSVFSSNVYGLQNSFGLAGGSLKGLFMVGDRKRVVSDNLFGDKAPVNTTVEEGRSQAIVQQFNSNMLGGKVRLNYQDIGDKFGGFSAFEGAGYTQAQIGQFANEKGLKRTDFQAEGIGGKALALKAGMKSVGDDQGSITWRNYGFNLLGIGINYEAFKVDPGFTRFQNIAEADRQQLAKERGLDRQTLGLGKTWKGGALKYDSTKVEGLDGLGFYRRAFSLSVPWMKADFGEQHVQAGFNRFNDLREADRGQLAREGGLVRQTESFALTPKGGPALNWSDSKIRTDAGDFDNRSFGLQYGRLSLTHGRLDVAPGFASLGAMAPQEIASTLSTIVKMTEPTANPQGQDNGGWGNLAGLNRSNWRLAYDLGKGSAFGYASQTVQGQKDDLQVNQASITTPKFSASYRDQDTGPLFTETNRLLFSEQQRLGTGVGVHKTDINVSAMLSGLKRLSYTRMTAEDAGGAARREIFGLTDKGFIVNYNRRSVDPGFTSLPGIVDPERDLLMGIMGYDQSELVGSWQLLPGLALKFQDMKAFNAATGLGRFNSMVAFKWNPDKYTEIKGTNLQNRQNDPTMPLVDQSVEGIQIDRKMGKLGNLSLSQQVNTYDGTQDQNPDATTQTLIYENQLSKTTSVRTQHSLTRYENGEHETLTSNSLSQALSSRIGVSVTDTKVERDGDKPDETHRDYGFWVDFGKNIRLNYKAVRNMNGDQGDMHNEVSVTPGETQGVKIGGASYTHNGWDDKRDQSIGNVSLSNIKPLNWGFIKDVRFNYGVDSVHDNDVWQKELRTMGFGGRIGAFGFGLDYKSQSLPDGDRAIDRVFSFTTDLTGKGWLRADVKYNLRTLPFGQQAMIRNYTLTAEPIKHWTVTHTLLTNPLQADNNALLGAVATPTRSNKWAIGFDGNPRTKFALGYEEFYNELSNQQVTAMKIGTTLFANNPSPLVLEYVMAESNASGTMQRSHGFNLAFNQRPGPNQSLSFKISNLNWELAHPDDQNIQNWNLRLDYSWKF